MAIPLGKCPTCDGSLLWEDGVRKCMACSREIRKLHDLKQFYNHNKDQIITSVKNLGQPKSAQLWKMSTSTLHTKIKSWGYREGRTTKAVPAPSDNHHRLELPPWSDNWPESVQLKWLDIFLQLDST